MQKIILETYDREYSLLESIKYSDERLMPEIESSCLISDFHKLFFDSFKIQLVDKNKKEIFKRIEEFCIDSIDLEYKRTNDLDSKEFSTWHLSMFTIIQSFVKITGSKYNLRHEEKIKRLFTKLLNEDFYNFLEFNSKERNLENISHKLHGIIKDDNIIYIITKTPKYGEIEFNRMDYELNEDFKVCTKKKVSLEKKFKLPEKISATTFY